MAGVELLQQQQSRAAAPGVLRRKSSPFIATLLSFIVPGLGAAYNGQTSKALVHFTIFASFFQMATVTGGAPFFLLGVVGSWLFAAVDAARTAQLIRSGLAPDAEADAIARRLYGNPVAWGVVLLALGGLFLLHVLGVVLPMRQFLPVVLVILGAYMLYDHLRHRGGVRDSGAGFEQLRRPPSAIGPGSYSSEMTRFGTGELAAQASARDAGVWPVDPRA